MKKVEITYMDQQLQPTTKITFINVVNVNKGSKSLILYFKDGTKQKIANDKWFSYITVNY